MKMAKVSWIKDTNYIVRLVMSFAVILVTWRQLKGTDEVQVLRYVCVRERGKKWKGEHRLTKEVRQSET